MIWYRFAGFRLESLPRYLEDHPFLRVILRMSREHLRSKHRPETSGRVIVRKMPSCMALWHNPKAFDRICFWNPDQRRNTGMFLFLIAKYVEIQMNGRFFYIFTLMVSSKMNIMKPQDFEGLNSKVDGWKVLRGAGMVSIRWAFQKCLGAHVA